MLNSMVVARQRVGDIYNIRLDLPEREYFDIYEDLDNEAAEDILKQYMTYHSEDGRYSDVSIHQSKTGIVSIMATLHYDENDHTEQFVVPPHLENRV